VVVVVVVVEGPGRVNHVPLHEGSQTPAVHSAARKYHGRTRQSHSSTSPSTEQCCVARRSSCMLMNLPLPIYSNFSPVASNPLTNFGYEYSILYKVPVQYSSNRGNRCGDQIICWLWCRSEEVSWYEGKHCIHTTKHFLTI
jgi:hypothetical protein